MRDILNAHQIEAREEEKYYTQCPKCAEARGKSDAKSLMVTSDSGFVRWQCLHAKQCAWNDIQIHKIGGKTEVKEVIKKSNHIYVPEGLVPPCPKESTLYEYKDTSDRTMFYVVRTKDKKFFPMCYTEDGEWVAEAWKGKSLYGAETLKGRDLVFVVEGEKARNAATEIFKKAAAVSWIGGANNIKKGDWDLLKGKEVVLWPDNDAAGIAAMQEIADELVGKASCVSMVDVSSLPAKYDLADDIDKEVIKELYNNRTYFSRSTVPSVLDVDSFVTNVSKIATGLGLGFGHMDKTLRLPQSGLAIIAGRSGHGKTTMMLNVAANMLRKTDKKVVYYSYEIPATRMLLKLLMCMEGVEHHVVPHKNEEKYRELLLNNELKAWDEVYPMIGKRVLFTDEPSNIDQLVEALDCESLEGAMVFIDYIQLIPSVDGRQSRYLAIKESADKLRAVANKRGQVIMTGSQLTDGETPYQDSVREGKDIQNAAELVLKLWNKKNAEAGDVMKTKKLSKADGGGEERQHYYDQVDGDFVIDVVKNRNGEVGKKYGFNLKFGAKLEEINIDKQFKEF